MMCAKAPEKMCRLDQKRVFITGLAGFARRPWYLLKLLPASITAVIDTIRRAATGRAMAAPFTAPRTVLNGKLTSDRKLAFAQLDLADVKKVANHFGVKINDVVMAIVGAPIRDVLAFPFGRPRRTASS